MSTLKLAPNLSLPPEAITQTFGVLAVRGAGKSNLAAVMAEEMHAARLPFVVVDPVGSWWGLRSSADGTGAGLAIPIFGGRHGDVPLEKNGGQVIADLVVDERVSCVLDISEFSEGDKTHFLIDFAERLYRRNTEPLHLFLEEADDYAPQRPFREQARLLRAWENVVRRGRARGLGITLITQRSAALNKNVLTQIETLFVLRTTSPQDRAAIAAWIQYHGQSKEVLESLDKLEPGEAWVWSPSWLKAMRRVPIRRRATFDSGATPKQLRGARPAATLADVDLGKVQEKMAATIERAKAEDPKELRRRIAELERQVAAAAKAKPPATVERVEFKRIEVPVLKQSDVARIEAAGDKCMGLAQAIGEVVDKLRAVQTATVPTVARQQVAAPPRATLPVLPKFTGKKENPRVAPRPPASGNGQAPEVGTGGLRRMLVVLAQRPDGLSDSQMGIRAGLSSRGGSFARYLSTGRSAGWIEGPRSQLRVTPAGLEALGEWEPLPTGPALLQYWLEQLGDSGAARMLQELAAAHPSTLDDAELGRRAGMSHEGGSFARYLSTLRGLQLTEGARSGLRASDELFE